MENKKETRGGSRLGSGAKPKYGEQTTTIAFRVPVSKVNEIKKMVKRKIAEYIMYRPKKVVKSNSIKLNSNK